MIGVERTDLSEMETSESAGQQDRLQLIAEKRKWQTEIENKRRQLEDDRRALQHLKSKALRERWLLDGAPSAGPEQDEVKRQLEQDAAKTKSLEDAIDRLEKELMTLETGGVTESVTTHTQVLSPSVKAVELKSLSPGQQERPIQSGQVVEVIEEVKVHKRPQLTQMTEMEAMKKVVHEMNGEDGVHLLSSTEVEELINKADEASVKSQTVTTITTIHTTQVQQESGTEAPQVTTEITGLEAKPESQSDTTEATTENPVTMVFMGYQNVEDEDETKKVLGLQGTVKAELVLIEDSDGKTSPGSAKDPAESPTAVPPMAVPQSGAPPAPTPEAKAATNGDTAGETPAATKKEKQPCKCCSIM
ncbi:paralemmin 1a isoform X2 [Synchiropus splendidus]|uniref:paralemmin 1a isoform X2 n=1 Tax=Synchiropus splendidus TaxID=270530 RepID=UPI00237E19DF|nr:paralemmin 1a isoform X2 [Synchiropus splendidus]